MLLCTNVRRLFVADAAKAKTARTKTATTKAAKTKAANWRGGVDR